MAKNSAPQRSSQETNRDYQLLALITVVTTFGLVALGGLVRVTESGLGCPDWPLCNGRLLPPLEARPILEYSHRLVAVITGLLIAATTLFTWRRYSSRRWLMVPSILALVLVVIQGLVGGATVIAELSGHLVLLHLAIAQVLIAVLLIVVFVALRGDPLLTLLRQEKGSSRRLPVLALATGLATYCLLLLGAYVTVSDAGTACGNTWPLCHGQVFFIDSHLATVHMLHRLVTLLVCLILAGTFAVAWGQRLRRPELLWGVTLAVILLVVQVFVGATHVWLEFPAATKLLHVTMATAVWMSMIGLTLLSLTPNYAAFKGNENA